MNEKTLEFFVGKYLRQRGLRLAVAESCTGGLVGHRITNIPGSSTFYMGSITAYAYEAKVRLLGVNWETLEKYGAVSKETVIEMALGVRRALASDIGISVSGIAGPGGGTPDKPVGTTWIGLSAPGVNEAWHHQWPGDRLQVKEEAAEQALQLLVDYLKDKPVASSTQAHPSTSGVSRMEPIEVTVRFDQDGKANPLKFTWQERKYLVNSTGRRWENETGQHILVMVPGERVYELIFVPTAARWFLGPFGRERRTA